MKVGAYPGSFNPPTVAHLAVARAAREQAGLDRVDLVLSQRPLGKEDVARPTVPDRVAVLHTVAGTRPWLGVRVTPQQLVADIAAGDQAVVVGADKWAQLLDPAWYGGSTRRRDAALAGLPLVLLAARGATDLPPHLLDVPALTRPVQVLDLPPEVALVSSTGARAGRRDWMLPEARAWDAATGAWSDPARYRARLPAGEPGAPPP